MSGIKQIKLEERITSLENELDFLHETEFKVRKNELNIDELSNRVNTNSDQASTAFFNTGHLIGDVEARLIRRIEHLEVLVRGLSE